ncbi:MAG TPA: peptidylprolyl isomerase [Chthoniobacterales bacterium]
MQITIGKVVSIDYTLTDDRQQTLDSSAGGEPLVYLHGVGQLIAGLENELEGKRAGETLKVKVPPAEGYGLRDESKVGVIPRAQIQGAGNLRVGAQLQASSPDGSQILTITKVEDDQITVDANHPLAGENLHFDVTIRDVRDATPEEASHGHVHGPGGHHHH